MPVLHPTSSFRSCWGADGPDLHPKSFWRHGSEIQICHNNHYICTLNAKTQPDMKKLLYFLVIILLGVGILSSCKKQDEDSFSASIIVGTWRVVSSETSYTEVGDYWEFRADGTLNRNGYPLGFYSYYERQGMVSYDANGCFKVLSIDATKMRIAFDVVNESEIALLLRI